MRKLTASVLGLGVAIAALTAPALADTSDKRIALSNNYAGNSWRQAMLGSWEKVAGQAQKDGVVSAADAFTTAENQVTEQAAQIQNLILQGYDAIVINAASPEGLNGAVKEACDAGVVVVSFDGIVTEPCAWRIAVDFHNMGKVQVEYLAGRLADGGNLLEIRGLAGVFVDDAISGGIHEGVGENSQFKISGSVHGNWAQDVAQKAVAGILPSMHQVGSFLGAWLGGLTFELTGSYDLIWWSVVLFGLVAALLHWPIDERPIAAREAVAGNG